MRRPIRPAWLLRLARELAGVGAAAGQPRNTNLRRAQSTSYYALFHAIALAVARSALPGGNEQEQYGYCRYITHNAIRQVCAWVAGETPPAHLAHAVTRLRNSATLTDVATTFMALHQSRESADYDHTVDITRPSTLGLVERAEGAVGLIDLHESTDEFQAFFGLIALRTGIGSRNT